MLRVSRCRGKGRQTAELGQRKIFVDNLLVRVHWIIEMIVVERPCAMEFEFPISVALYLATEHVIMPDASYPEYSRAGGVPRS